MDRNVDIQCDLSKLDNVIDSSNNCNILLSVDSNCRSTTWFDFKTDRRGRDLEDYISEKSLHILNVDTGQPTFFTVNGQSNIDLTLVTSGLLGLVRDWKIESSESASDHRLITFLISNFCNESNTHIRKKYKITEDKQQQFLSHFTSQINQILNQNNKLESLADINLSNYIKTCDNIDKCVAEIFDKIETSCKNFSVSKLKDIKNKKRSVTWWSKELTEMRKKCNRLRRLYQRTKNNMELRENRKTDYCNAKKSYSAKLKSSKKISWINYCNSVDKRNPWNSAYKLVAGKLKSSLTLSTLQKADGSWTSDVRDTLLTLLDNFYPNDDPSTDDNHHTAVRQSMDQDIDTEPDRPFSFIEIVNVLKSMDGKKAPGHDGITSNILLLIMQTFPKSFTVLYNECLERNVFPTIWKKSITIPILKPGRETETRAAKFRPISLLPVGGKLLEKLMINRVMYCLNSQGLLSNKQFGFRPQVGTTHCLLHVKKFIDENIYNKKDVLLISLDVEGAFNSAWWPEIISQLRNFQCPCNLFKLIKNYFVDRKTYISLNTNSIERNITRGCPQGSCCGPGLWAIMYDSILKLPYPNGVEIIAFADDLLLLISGQNGMVLEALANESLRKIEKWSYKTKIKFNATKSKALHITHKRNVYIPKIYLDNSMVQIDKNLKFLGVYFDCFYNWKYHVDYICDRTLKLSNMLSRIARVYWGFGLEALRVMYSGALVPAMSYACVIWLKALQCKKYKNKLLRTDRLLLIRVIRGYRTISYEAAGIIANITPIDLKIKEIAAILSARIEGTHRVNTGNDEMVLALDVPAPCQSWIHPASFPHITEGHQDEDYEYVLYTDGSKDGDCVGGAAVLYHHDTEVMTSTFRISSYCSNNQAEALAVLKALDLLTKIPTDDEPQRACIKTDSRVTIDSIKDPYNHIFLIHEIRKKLLLLDKWKVDFSWVKAHSNIMGNERADQLAKASSKNQQLEYELQRCPLSYVEAKVRLEIYAEWERRWQNCSKGSVTREFFPTLSARQKTKQLNLTFKLTQILSGHGKMRAYLHRFKIIASACCPCDSSSEQTVGHLVLDCPLLDHKRYKLLSKFTLGSMKWPPHQLHLLLHQDYIQNFCDFINSIDFSLF